jgi:methylglutaconyl-CoA hydratase
VEPILEQTADMRKNPCELTVDEHGVARIQLCQPESHNALNPELLESLYGILHRLDHDPEVRSVELASASKHFCSGMDLKWLQESCGSAGKPLDKEFYRLGAVLHKLYHLSKPTVVIARGAAYGGGAGLLCCCDVALAAPAAQFCFSEVRLGLIPSMISPFVIHAIGERIARRYFLTGEKIDAAEAHRIGLVHDVIDDKRLSQRAIELHRAFRHGAPQAISRIKSRLTAGESIPLNLATLQQTVDWLEETRNTEEAREGISAFLAKRRPHWAR